MDGKGRCMDGTGCCMDGKGRCMDNIFVERLWRSLKYEEVYLNALRRWQKTVVVLLTPCNPDHF